MTQDGELILLLFPMAKKLFEQGTSTLGKKVNEFIWLNKKPINRSSFLDSTNLEIFLENLEDNVILIAVTFDEASTK